jgi:hypothetical protein
MAASKQTESRWRALVREQEESGRSVKEFAQARDLSAATLYWWRSALGRQARRKSPRLVELALVASGRDETRMSAPHFELVLAGGRCLRVPGDFDAESLRTLLGVLEE